MLKFVLLAASAMGLAGCGHMGHDRHAAGHEGHMMQAPEAPALPVERELGTASALLLGASGQQIGTAYFEQGRTGLLIRVEIVPGGLTPGWHGMHLHEKGDCSDAGTFQLSGGHHGKTAGAHGLLNPDNGPEAGDLPNVWAGADGAAGYEAFTRLTDLFPALDSDGLAIVVHASVDDHRSQPVGGAGARVACGVVERFIP